MSNKDYNSHINMMLFIFLSKTYKQTLRIFSIGLLFLFFFTTHSVLAGPLLPAQMDQSKMKKVLKVLGPATSSTPLSSPYPLGGWEGFEVGISKHYLPWSYLSEVDQTVGDQKDLDFHLLTIGKGLFYNFDLFLSIIPIIKSEALNYFSTQLRYQFWASENRIFYLSGIFFAGTSTINNQLNMQNNGLDFLGTITLDRVSIFLGIGRLFSTGRFIGGASGITASQATETERLTLSHQLVGIEWPIGNFFIAAEADRYTIPYYSIKLGYRQ